MDTIDLLVKKALSRRAFVAGAGSIAAASAIAGCSNDGAATIPVVSTTAAYSDTDILNFALNLEYLEAEFYLYAATGKGLATTDIGSGTSTTGSGAGTTTAGTAVPNLSVAQQQFINELADTEQEHVRALRAALGANAVARPNLNLLSSFTAAATAANTLTVSSGAQIPASFSPYASFDAFNVGVFVFEDVGVTAYNGAAPLISAAGITAGYLAAAAGIMAVEAYHAAAARSYLTANLIANGGTTASYPYLAYANQIAALRSALSGGSATTLAGEKYLTTPTGTSPYTTTLPTLSSLVPADNNALAFSRTTDQVLHIVYGTFSNTAGSTTPAAGVAAGGFFPNGLNGNIKITQS